MIMTMMLISLFIAAILAWQLEKKRCNSAKVVALVAVTVVLLSFIYFVINSDNDFSALVTIINVSWIATFDIYFSLAVDHLSILLIILTLILAIIAILISWHEITEKQGFYYFNLLTAIAGIIGVFVAHDMFLFFFFWEVMLLPMTALIAIWGHENRSFAAIKFFIFTQVSSLCMLIAIIVMAYLYAQQYGSLSFNYTDWLTLTIPENTEYVIMLGFFIAFAVKLPSVPVHSWLPDAHTQAPTAGSVLLAGVLLKTGAYGLIRFVILLFPSASMHFAPIAVTLGVISIIYGAKMAFAQRDFKRLVAYSSISHMGFVMLALFAFNANAFQGAVYTMLAHGLSSAALFCIAGMLYQRIHSRDLKDMGGFWTSAPWMAGVTLLFGAAAFGLPGLANFIGEFYSLVGAFSLFPIHTVIAALGIIGSAIYGTHLFQSSFHGPMNRAITDFTRREVVICGSLAISLLVLGLFPQLILQFSMKGGY